MTVEQIAQTHYRRSTLTTQRVVAAVLAIWRATGPSGFRDELTRAAGLVAAGQLAQATQAAAYLIDLAVEQDLAAADAVVVPRSLAGTAANGRPLVDALGSATSRAWELLDAGADIQSAALSGQATLTRVVSNEVTQAGNNATHIGMTGQGEMTGYTRMLQAPSCSRCVILAGKWFKWNDGFKRHPGCDCVHVPAAEAADVADIRTDPRGYFDSLSQADQDKYFGKANAEAIREGSDIGQVVNTSIGRVGSRTDGSRRAVSGLYEFDANGRTLQATTQGTTIRQGRAGRRMAIADGQIDGRIPSALERTTRPRLTPKSIYEIAGDDRTKARQLLYDYGYLDSRPISRDYRSLLADAGRPNPALGRR